MYSVWACVIVIGLTCAQRKQKYTKAKVPTLMEHIDIGEVHPEIYPPGILADIPCYFYGIYLSFTVYLCFLLRNEDSYIELLRQI